MRRLITKFAYQCNMHIAARCDCSTVLHRYCSIARGHSKNLIDRLMPVENYQFTNNQ